MPAIRFPIALPGDSLPPGSLELARAEIKRLQNPLEGAKVLEMAMNESQHGMKFIAWRDDFCRTNPEAFPGLEDLHHIPNGGKRDAMTALKMKREGVLPGVPDYFLPVPFGGRFGLYVELKTIGGRVRPEQKAFLDKAGARGYGACVAFGWREAAMLTLAYMAGLDPFTPKPGAGHE